MMVMMMANLCEFIFLLLLLLPGLIRSLESPESYRPSSFISSHLTPAGSYRRETRLYLPPFPSDLQPQESKLKEAPNRPSSSAKKVLFRPYDWDDADFSNERFTSGEFSNESNSALDSGEHDDRQYTIGTKIRVQHPPSVPKKSTNHKPAKSSHPAAFKISSSSYRDKDISSFEPFVPVKPRSHKQPQLYDLPEPPLKVATTQRSASASSYNVYEPEQDDFPLNPIKSRTSHHFEQLKGVASKKQIEKYLEDQQKLLDEALKIQLLKNPRLQQYLRSKEKERVNSEPYESEELQYPKASPNGFVTNFSDKPIYGGQGRRPPGHDFNRPFKNKPQIKSNKAKPVPRRFRSAIVINV